MKPLSDKRILLGVSGSIAAYKSADLVRQLRDAGAQVRVVMTAAAREFITPLTLQTLSGQKVWCDWSDEDAGMGHIELARWADRILLAPAAADTLARLAQGRADDLLAAVCLASRAPLCVAPAMNQAMWRHPATQANLACLRERGARVFGPADGVQACGETGPGRMLEPQQLVEHLSTEFTTGSLEGLNVLVTAGPTRESIDPVRYLSNRSSGKMGYALARAAREAGARVVLVSGPVSLDPPEGVERVAVESAAEMSAAVMERVAGCDLFLSVAAVADYRVPEPAGNKIKKHQADLELKLVPGEDILAAVSALPDRPFCLGFAAETEQLEEQARRKRLAKGIELIAANRVGDGRGFDSDDNELLLVWEGGSQWLEKDSKSRLARRLIEVLAPLYHQARSGGGSGTHAENSA